MQRWKKRLGSLLLSFAMTVTLICPALAANLQFSDIGGHWAQAVIDALVEKDIVVGYEDGECHPDLAVTREQFAALMARALEIEEKEVDELPFRDIAERWSCDSVTALTETGIIRKKEYSEGFEPDKEITRMEMVVMILRALGKETEAAQYRGGSRFADRDEISPSDEGYVNLADEYGILVGYPDRTVRPYQGASRAEAFCMIYRMLNIRAEETENAEDKDVSPEPTSEPAPDPTQEPTPTPTTKPSSGSTIAPTPQFNFTLPLAAYVGETVVVVVDGKNVDSVMWSLAQNDGALGADALTANGGTLIFSEAGTYTLTAVAENNNGKTVSCERSVTVYPMVSIELELPDTVHTDEGILLSLTTKNLGDLPVCWSATKDGKEIVPEEYLLGTFEDQSLLTVTAAGTYTLTATVTDALGRTYTATDIVVCYPVGTIGFFLPTVFHTDDTVTVEVTITELGDNLLNWTLIRDGEVVSLEDVAEGMLQADGGQLRFSEIGAYTLTASYSDAVGRLYSYQQSFTVYPVPHLEYSIPSTAWTDREITVEVENSGTEFATVEWLVSDLSGSLNWSDVVEGTLGKDGGIICFKKAGSYTICVKTVDVTGRTDVFAAENDCVVKEPPSVQVKVLEQFRTDRLVEVSVEGFQGMSEIEWTLFKDGSEVDISEYYTGITGTEGGEGYFAAEGEYTLVVSGVDAGRSFSAECSFLVYPVSNFEVTLQESNHIGTPFTVALSGADLADCEVTWELLKEEETAVYSGTLAQEGGTVTISELGEYAVRATITDRYGDVYTAESSIRITNTTPSKPGITCTINYNDNVDAYTSDCKVKVTVSVSGNDPDGDSYQFVHAEDGALSGYYGIGSYTVKVRCEDQWGASSGWSEYTFTVGTDKLEVDLYCDTLGNRDGINEENLDFSLEVHGGWQNRIAVADYHNPAQSESVSQMSLSADNRTINGWFAFGRHIVLVKATDIFGNTAYGARAFIVSDDEHADKSSITTLSTTVTEEGLYNGDDLLAYIGGFTFNIPAISGHSTGCCDVIEIFGVLEDGTQELVLTFKTNNGYVYVHSDGIYKCTYSGSTVRTNTWSGWESEKYTKLIFHYQMTAGHESCLLNATEGLNYRVRYTFIPEQIAKLESLFSKMN